MKTKYTFIYNEKGIIRKATHEVAGAFVTAAYYFAGVFPDCILLGVIKEEAEAKLDKFCAKCPN